MYDAFSRMEILMGTRAVNRLGSAKLQFLESVVRVLM